MCNVMTSVVCFYSRVLITILRFSASKFPINNYENNRFIYRLFENNKTKEERKSIIPLDSTLRIR